MPENSIEKIFKTSGPKSKIIIMVRHGHKTMDGQHITMACLDDIIRNGVPGITNRVNIIQHGSHYPRTDETVCAIMINVLQSGGIITKHLPADYRLGNSVFFGLYTKEVKIIQEQNKWSYYEGLEKLRPEKFKEVIEGIKNFTEETFAIMDPSDVCLVPSHTPTVEMAYNAYAFPRRRDPKMEAKELEIIFLVQSERDIDMYKNIYSLRLNYPEIGVKI